MSNNVLVRVFMVKSAYRLGSVIHGWQFLGLMLNLEEWDWSNYDDHGYGLKCNFTKLNFRLSINWTKKWL